MTHGVWSQALLLTVLLGAHVTAQSPPTFRTEARLVVLQVTVTSRDGRLVTDLERGAFTVYEDGRPQPIAVFSRDDVPISLGLLIDNSGSMRSVRAAVEAAALAFVRASHPSDDVFVLNFADRPRIDVPFTTDIGVLSAGIRRVDSIGGTALRDAILMAERYHAASATHDRRALLVITDGRDNASQASRLELRKAVERSGAMVFAVTLGDEDRPRDAGRDLEIATGRTGGTVAHVSEAGNVEAVVADIAHRLRNQYLIACMPTNLSIDGSFRSVRVAVHARRELSAHTRAGYRAAAR